MPSPNEPATPADQLAAILSAIEAALPGFHPGKPAHFTSLPERVRAAIAADARDAERYRWLRNVADSVDWTQVKQTPNGVFWTLRRCRILPSDMDADIDAALRAIKED